MHARTHTHMYIYIIYILYNYIYIIFCYDESHGRWLKYVSTITSSETETNHESRNPKKFEMAKELGATEPRKDSTKGFDQGIWPWDDNGGAMKHCWGERTKGITVTSPL